ncbi:type II 3-dehydroquinate dehydratase [Kordiimonas sp. SCSIO 12610]|uniref:type II 3-dehydroquinate dehydratase n=1 Tax=Kordiimonas sp. SCSIO 12610 TaxID=2829597 RepID=UPI00210ED53E|nr:type II 3-dehydroquinate dehydratase [Kordiimonas sp. SCSIO 12610]UTW53839.1 type II 3-dehydroquinate dehydratase [Kordiimonas sp. SCSIO 12610]
MSDNKNNLIYILNGPNLNLLGTREVDIYGETTLADLQEISSAKASECGYACDFRQTNTEGELVDWIQEGGRSAAGIIINAAAYTHTSVAIHDAIAAIDVPVIEVHLSNIFAREDYRHHSFVSDVSAGVICGFGANGYKLAVTALADLLQQGS